MLDQFKVKKPTDIDTKVGLIAWIVQIVGMFFIHIFALAIFGIATAFVAVNAWGTKFWFLILLALACMGVCIAGVAGIVIDICNIVCLIREIKTLKQQK